MSWAPETATETVFSDAGTAPDAARADTETDIDSSQVDPLLESEDQSQNELESEVSTEVEVKPELDAGGITEESEKKEPEEVGAEGSKAVEADQDKPGRAPPPSPKITVPARRLPKPSAAKSSLKGSMKSQRSSFGLRPNIAMRITQQLRLGLQQEPVREREFLSGSESDSASDSGNFLPKGAFLLTPSHDLSLEKASLICEKMNFTAPFSLTKTATGILFKFARPEDFQATYKKGFHKVTGARFYKKIPIPCRPQKTFVVFVLEVPEDVPEEDIRHSLYKFHSVVEVRRLDGTGGPAQLAVTSKGSTTSLVSSGGTSAGAAVAGTSAAGPPSLPSDFPCGGVGAPPIIRVTLASLEEYNNLLQNGLDFYGATFFPTEAGTPGTLSRGVVGGNGSSGASRRPGGNRILDVVTASGQRVRDLLPVFDSAGFTRIPPPAIKTVKPSKSR